MNLLNRYYMKILITTDCYLNNIAGITASVLALCKGLRRYGHEIRTLSLSDCNQSFRDGKDYYIKSFPAYYYEGMRSSFAMRDPLLQELAEWRPDIIHVQTEGATYRMALRIRKQCSAPLIMTCHTDYAHFVFGKYKSLAPVKLLMRLTGKILYRQADRVTVPSQKAAHFPFLSSVEDRLTVVPNGMEIEKYQNQFSTHERNAFRMSLGIDDRTGVLVTVARLSKEKNIQELISYLPELLKRNADIKLLIVGDGPDSENLYMLTEKLQLWDKVHFTGRIPPENVWQYYAAGDLYVSASTVEVHSMSFLEALASGRPLLCREDDALIGVLEHGINGMIYHSQEEFINFAVQILGDDELREDMGLRSARMAEQFSNDAFARTMLKIYEEAMNEKEVDTCTCR